MTRFIKVNPVSQKRYMEFFKPFLLYQKSFFDELDKIEPEGREHHKKEFLETVKDIEEKVKKIRLQFFSDDQKLYVLRILRAWYIEGTHFMNPDEAFDTYADATIAAIEKNKKLATFLYEEVEWWKVNGSPDPNSPRLTHYMGNARVNNIKSIINYKFNYDISWRKNVDKIEELEQEFNNQKKYEPGPLPKDAKLFLKVNDQFSWYSFDKGYSDEVGNMMNHCGNAPSVRDHDIFLTLARKIDSNTFSFHLGFVINNGIIGESKGNANSKPQPRYHPAIVKLLMDKRVILNLGGGYKEDNNFAFNDLAPELKEHLIKNKPSVTSVDNFIKHSKDLKGKDIVSFLSGIDEIFSDDWWAWKLEKRSDGEYLVSKPHKVADAMYRLSRADEVVNSDAVDYLEYESRGHYSVSYKDIQREADDIMKELRGLIKQNKKSVKARKSAKKVEKFLLEAEEDEDKAEDLRSWIAWSYGDAYNSADESNVQSMARWQLFENEEGFSKLGFYLNEVGSVYGKSDLVTVEGKLSKLFKNALQVRKDGDKSNLEDGLSWNDHQMDNDPEFENSEVAYHLYERILTEVP